MRFICGRFFLSFNFRHEWKLKTSASACVCVNGDKSSRLKMTLDETESVMLYWWDLRKKKRKRQSRLLIIWSSNYYGHCYHCSFMSVYLYKPGSCHANTHTHKQKHTLDTRKLLLPFFIGIPIYAYCRCIILVYFYAFCLRWCSTLLILIYPCAQIVCASCNAYNITSDFECNLF